MVLEFLTTSLYHFYLNACMRNDRVIVMWAEIYSLDHSRPQSSSAHDQQGGRALGNPGTYTAPDWFTAETIETKETFD